MKIVYKILLVSILLVSLGLTRTSGKFSASDSFFDRVELHKKALIVEDERSNSEEGSLKWKRRHKRRKKAPYRRPRRGK